MPVFVQTKNRIKAVLGIRSRSEHSADVGSANAQERKEGGNSRETLAPASRHPTVQQQAFSDQERLQQLNEQHHALKLAEQSLLAEREQLERMVSAKEAANSARDASTCAYETESPSSSISSSTASTARNSRKGARGIFELKAKKKHMTPTAAAVESNTPVPSGNRIQEPGTSSSPIAIPTASRAWALDPATATSLGFNGRLGTLGASISRSFENILSPEGHHSSTPVSIKRRQKTGPSPLVISGVIPGTFKHIPIVIEDNRMVFRPNPGSSAVTVDGQLVNHSEASTSHLTIPDAGLSQVLKAVAIVEDPQGNFTLEKVHTQSENTRESFSSDNKRPVRYGAQNKHSTVDFQSHNQVQAAMPAQRLAVNNPLASTSATISYALAAKVDSDSNDDYEQVRASAPSSAISSSFDSSSQTIKLLKIRRYDPSPTSHSTFGGRSNSPDVVNEKRISINSGRVKIHSSRPNSPSFGSTFNRADLMALHGASSHVERRMSANSTFSFSDVGRTLSKDDRSDSGTPPPLSCSPATRVSSPAPPSMLIYSEAKARPVSSSVAIHGFSYQPLLEGVRSTATGSSEGGAVRGLGHSNRASSALQLLADQHRRRSMVLTPRELAAVHAESARHEQSSRP